MKVVQIFLALMLTAIGAQVTAAPSSNSALQTYRLDAEERGSKETPPNYWEWSGFGNGIGKSRFLTPGYGNEKIGYTEVQTLLTYNYFFNSCTAVQIGGGYGHVGLHWKQNPAFSQQDFDSACVTLGGYSQVGRWVWRAMFTARFNTDEPSVPDYVLYTYGLWGRYSLSSWYGVHFGAIAESGLRKDTVWPVLGLDCQLTELVRVYAVYPFEANIHYDFSCPWAMELALRRFRYRDRAGKSQPVSKALLEYRNTGCEFRLVYDSGPLIIANVHVGCAFGGDLRIGNHKDEHAIHYKFRPAPYAGAEFTLKF